MGGRSLYWIIFSHHIHAYHLGCGGGRAHQVNRLNLIYILYFLGFKSYSHSLDNGLIQVLEYGCINQNA